MYHNQRKRPADTQEDAWVADEDRFVLKQAKKKAAIRVKEGRAKPIDWLAVTLRFSDTTRSVFDDEVQDSELNIVDPEGVFEGLNNEQLAELERDISMYAALESDKTNLDFWQTMTIICKDRRRAAGPKGRSQDTVSAEVDRLFSSKNLTELEGLEKSIRGKLASEEPIDVEYWENLLQNLMSWKAKAKLRSVSRSIVDGQLKGLRKQQQEEAEALKSQVSSALQRSLGSRNATPSGNPAHVADSSGLDPEPLLKPRIEDKGIPIQDETTFLNDVATSRRRVIKLGFVPLKKPQAADGQSTRLTQHRNASGQNEEHSRVTTALYEREAARGIDENEEVFTSEEQVTTEGKPLWANKHRPRKPRYFNRVAMGYEWNKYNQTHYDHENPPPKVVQGYKFNIFYPDLIDKTKAPTYRIEREGGRKRGQTFAPAGEEDTCLIRFISGPPYEDIAFRIVDREWDYSAKRERGFKSSFDKGILQLHFQFKKIFYRK